ncbi:FAD-dependent oxidoreductase [Leucobacter weissii]|uniref:FAD-dependent oxidoreductase n=1 Tax=Leucobacter weissii TaxID=1983706 RepID=A0A939SA57_9MICO|nr:FAD-dependent oxidoreductase [Leucobacter weissii]MBO1901587.1 FAD-dependent oxidoreductase [Leucobacter weissii]
MRTVVIGGGVIGLTAAYHLAREGEEVVVVDQRKTGLGASDVNAGWVVPAESAPVPGPGVVLSALKWMTRPDSPLYIKPSLRPDFVSFMLGMFRASNAKAQRAGFAAHLALAEDSVHLFDEYRADGIDYELHHRGLLMAFKDRELMHHHLGYVDLTERYGLAPEKLIGDDVRVHEPKLNDSVQGGLFFPKELHLDPGGFAAALHARLIEMGVEIVEHAPIDEVRISDGRILRVGSRGRSFAGDRFLLSAGAWTGPLSKLFGARIPIRPGKGYCVEVAPFGLRGATNLHDAKVATTPFSDRFRLAGTMEFGGLDEKVNQVRVDAILRAPGAYFRDWEPPAASEIRPRAGMRPMSPDGLAVIGRLPRLANGFVSTGHGMLGVTLAPATARVLTELIRTGRDSPLLAPFSPARFRGGR